MNQKNLKLGTEKMWKLILSMSIPCILAQLVNMLYNIVDRIYIGNMKDVGEVAIGALGLCSPIIIFISAFASFISGGAAPIAGRSLGEKNNKKAEQILGNSIFLLLAFGVILVVVAYSIKDFLLYKIGASDESFPYANSYLSIYLIGTFFVLFTMGLNSFLITQGKSIQGMICTLVGTIINIVLDPILIFGFNLGIEGAAIATVISQGISAILIFSFLLNKKMVLEIKLKNFIPSLPIILAILKLGVASFIMGATESVIGFALNGQLYKYGGDIHVSTLAILQSAMLLITVPITGFTQGITPIISYNYGALNIERVKSCFRKVLLVCFLSSFIMALAMILFPTIFGRMFTSSPNLLNLVKKNMPIFVFGMLIFGIQRACQTTFVGLGQSLISLFIAILRKIILLVPFTYLFPLFMGVKGVYFAEGLADSIAAILCGTIFFFTFKKILKNMETKIQKKGVEALNE